jgi:uncharacterized protein (DUF2236 family)
MANKPNDVGLFGPSSVSWHLHAEPAMWLAGIRSLYLQALHPRAVAGIVQNSDFRRDPLGRLIRTANFVGASTYSPQAEVARLAERVRSVHRSLRGTYEGSTFRIDEPELLLWVHCAEVSSFLTVVRRAGFPLTATHADQYLDEQRRSAALVGLDPAEVPGSVAAMRAYFQDVRATLCRTEDTDLIYDFLHRPPVAGRLALGLPVYETVVGHLAYSLLPSWAVSMYGRRAYPAALSTVAMRTLAETMRALQRTVRTVVREPRLGPLVPHPVLAVRRLGKWAAPSASRLPVLV